MKRWCVLLAWMGLPMATASSDPGNLEGGVFLAHHPPGIQYSQGVDWCQAYFESFAIDSCSEQHNRIDLDGNEGQSSIWYVLAAWNEEKEWCGAEFGFGEYDPDAYAFIEWGPCSPGENLEIPSATWPGPSQGTAVTTTDAAWSGNFVPIYFFSGYAYYEGVIPLAVDPATAFGGTGNCATPPESWAAAGFGGMGLFTDGIYACPEGGLDGGGGGTDGAGEEGPEGEGQDEYSGGGDALIIRFDPNVISFPQDRADTQQYFEAPVGDAVLGLPSLEALLANVGAQTFATVAPGWRHLTPERSLDIDGNPVDLVDFTDVYRVTLDGETSAQEAIAALWNEPGIVYAERDGAVTLYDMPDAPHDPFYADSCCGQWYLNNEGDQGECGCSLDVDMNIPEAWAICYERDPPINAGTKIGIMDTRINETHEDLRAFIDSTLSGSFASGEWQNWVGYWGTGGNPLMGGHGTMMAALAGAGTDNADTSSNYLGIASIANVSASHAEDILVALVNSDVGLGGGGVGGIAAAVKGLEWVCTYPLARGRIRVVNMSWGRPRWKFCHDLADTVNAVPGLATLRDACRNAFRTGVDLVAAAGNREDDPPQGGWDYRCGESADTVLAYPAAFPDYCLAVAALGCRGQLHDPPFRFGSYIDVAGPGVGADSLGLVPSDDGQVNYQRNLLGTSPASPVIASAIALLLGAQPNLSPEDCYALLKASARPYGHAKYEVGAGMPRLDRALGWVTGDTSVVHGSATGFASCGLEDGWDTPRPVVLKNIPPELCEEGNGEVWDTLQVQAYRVTSIVQIDPPENGSIEMVWPRGVGSSGWRLLDRTLEGYPDDSMPPFYDVNYYENWARLDGVDGNQYTFTSYTYKIVRAGQDSCWVPFNPDSDPGCYNLNYSYVAYDPNRPSSARDLPEAGSLRLAVRGTPARLGGSVHLRVWLPDPARVWLGVYGVDGRLVRMFEDGGRMGAGTTEFTWDLTDSADRRAAAGVYFVRAKARLPGTGQVVTRTRVVLVK